VARWGWLILSDRGEAGRAEELLRRALVIQERYFGPRHPSLTFTLNGLARLEENAEDLPAAETIRSRVSSARVSNDSLDM